MSIEYASLTLPGTKTTVYGWVCEGTLIEAFATHPSGCGVSDGCLGRMHPAPRGAYTPLSQAQFNAVFLNIGLDEMDEVDEHVSLGELITRYPVEA